MKFKPLLFIIYLSSMLYFPKNKTVKRCAEIVTLTEEKISSRMYYKTLSFNQE